SVVFIASDEWLDGWLKRNNKTLRRVTSTGRDLPSNFGVKLADFLKISIECFRNVNRDRTKIFNMDETSIYLDCPSRYTYATKRSKRIRVETNGAELVRISAVFTGFAAGEKLTFFLLVPRIKELENYEPPNNIRITLIYKTGGIFNEDTICDYLTTISASKLFIFGFGAVSFDRKNYVLAIQWLSEIWDNFESHLIKNSFDSCGISSQETLHSILCDLVNRNLKFGSFVDNIEEEEEVMGFTDEDNFDENLKDFVGNNEAA
ncbi:unnamed protein product, partial [Brachionus calyciflorus]